LSSTNHDDGIRHFQDARRLFEAGLVRDVARNLADAHMRSHLNQVAKLYLKVRKVGK
jgi:hypothetical protein